MGKEEWQSRCSKLWVPLVPFLPSLSPGGHYRGKFSLDELASVAPVVSSLNTMYLNLITFQ